MTRAGQDLLGLGLKAMAWPLGHDWVVLMNISFSSDTVPRWMPPDLTLRFSNISDDKVQ